MKQYLLSRGWIDETILHRGWTDERNLGCVAKTLYNDKINPKTDLTDPHI